MSEPVARDTIETSGYASASRCSRRQPALAVGRHRAIVTFSLALAAVAVAAAGCGDDGRADRRSPVPLAVWRSEPVVDSLAALIEGRLVVDQAAGCVWLETGGGRSGVVWPVGTRLDAAGELHLPNGQRAEAGDALTGSGGGFPYDQLPSVALTAVDRIADAQRCGELGSGTVWIFPQVPDELGLAN